jgi:hypothetical protein
MEKHIMKIISIKAHQFMDYATVVIFALLPSLFMFSGTPAYLSYFLAAVHLLPTFRTCASPFLVISVCRLP